MGKGKGASAKGASRTGPGTKGKAKGGKGGRPGWAFVPMPLGDIGARVQAAVDDEWLWVEPRRQSGKVRNS